MDSLQVNKSVGKRNNALCVDLYQHRLFFQQQMIMRYVSSVAKLNMLPMIY